MRASLDEARTVYAWSAVARRIAAVYEEVIEEAVPTDWTAHYDPALRTLADADLSCRFRAEPHLL